MKEKRPSIHTGHRQRVKEEFRAAGLAGMADHRVLELVLFYAIPQGDVNPLAHRLMEHFGSLAGVFHATYEQLLEVKGIGESAATLIQLFPAVGGRYMAAQAEIGEQMRGSWQFKSLLEPLFFGARNEMAYLVCMDNKGKVLATRKLGEGIVNEVPILMRKAVEAALGCNATRVVLAHNHVAGIAAYSVEDKAATMELRRLLRQVGVVLEDHFVFANDEMISMRQSGCFEWFDLQEC